MNTADPALDTRITAFAAAVRAHLDDLDPEDLDDLTGGLEADLHEEASDHDGDLDLGDPVRYAEELRASAGLPERAGDAPPPSPLAVIREQGRAAMSALQEHVRANRGLSALLDIAITFRPVWWLLRGWAGYQCTLLALGVLFSVDHGPFAALPRGPMSWLLLLALTAISVQWGRGRWAPNRGLRAVRTTVSVVTALALVVMLPVTIARAGDGRSVTYVSPTAATLPGLELDGTRVTNVFAYDAEGNLLERVQLFDQDGAPITTVGTNLDHATGRASDPLSGAEHAPADGAWNVYPLEADDARVATGHSTGAGTRSGTGASVGTDGEVRPPFAKALPLPAREDAVPSTAPDATGQGADTATPAPTPTPTTGSAPAR